MSSATGRPQTVGSNSIVYDAFNRMVEFNNGSTHTQMLFDPQGTLLGQMRGQSLSWYLVPLAGGLQAVYGPGGLDHYRHIDWLGSSRLQLTINGGLYSSRAFAPFGKTYVEVGVPDRSFTGNIQDFVQGTTGVYDFLLRQHASSQGRWLVPDPAGMAAVDLANPQTWNRYAYVGNNPLSNIDPLGLECVWDDGSFDSAGDPNTGSVGQCQNAGGTYFDPSTFKAGGGQDWNPNPNAGIASLLGNAADYQWVGNATGYGITQTPTSNVTVNGTTGQVDYVGWGFGDSDIALSPSAQAYANAISGAFRNFPNICGVGGAVYFGKGKLGVGVSADTQNGIHFASGFSFFDVNGAKAGYTISGGANGNISYSVPTPFAATVDVGTQNGSLRSIQSISLSSKSPGWRNLSAYANLSNMGDQNCR